MNTFNPETVKVMILASLAGYAGTLINSIPRRIFNSFKYFTSTSFSFREEYNTDTHSIAWLLIRSKAVSCNSIILNHLSEKSSRLQLSKDEIDWVNKELGSNISCNSNSRKELYYVGHHTMYLGKGLFLEISSEDIVREASTVTTNSVKISFFGIGAKKAASEFKNTVFKIEGCLDLIYANRRETSKVETVTVSYANGNMCATARYSDTVFFNEKNELLTKLERFITSEELYKKLGVPYKFNILLYGEPGTGKTSVAKMIATEFTRDGNLTIDNSSCMDNSFHNSLNKVREILLIDEIDTKCKNRSDIQNNSNASSVIDGTNLQGLLELLDGAHTINGLIAVATTNHIDKLDPALLRRFDMKIHMGKIDRNLCEDMCEYYGLDLEFLDKLDIEYPVNPSLISRILIDEVMNSNIGKIHDVHKPLLDIEDRIYINKGIPSNNITIR